MAEFSDDEWVKGVVRHDGVGLRSTVGGTVFSSTVKEGVSWHKASRGQ